jgi:hypothetical protein
LWPTRYSRELGEFVDVRTVGGIVDVTYDSDSDETIDFDLQQRPYGYCGMALVS